MVLVDKSGIRLAVTLPIARFRAGLLRGDSCEPIKLRQNSRQVKTVYGSFVRYPDASLIEVLGYLGWDFLVFDAEHGTLEPRTVRTWSALLSFGTSPHWSGSPRTLHHHLATDGHRSTGCSRSLGQHCGRSGTGGAISQVPPSRIPRTGRCTRCRFRSSRIFWRLCPNCKFRNYDGSSDRIS
jgi:hypothetical protein